MRPSDKIPPGAEAVLCLTCDAAESRSLNQMPNNNFSTVRRSGAPAAEAGLHCSVRRILDRTKAADRNTLLLFFGSTFLSVGLPLSTYVARSLLINRTPLPSALWSLERALFVPGDNLFLIVVLNSIAFLAFAPVVLLHLGSIRDPKVKRERQFGLIGAAVLLAGFNGYICIDFFLGPLHPTIAPLLLPFTIFCISPGYLTGRFAARLFSRQYKPIHPGLESLLSYHDGELDPKRTQDVALHLASCSDCQREVAQIEKEQEFLTQLCSNWCPVEALPVTKAVEAILARI